MKILKVISAFSLILILASCSGTGSSYSSVKYEVDQAEGKVFVLRDTGWSCSACLITVNLNGKRIGKIGNKEVVIGNIESGTNYIKAEVAGIQSIGLNGTSARFNSGLKTNKFFVLTQTVGLVSAKMKLLETSETSWRSQAN